MLKVSAVIVTNNRLTLLQEAVAAIRAQTYTVINIIVVNNASTDGTTEWLNTQTGLIVINQENLGGSGGFYTGIKTALLHHAEWIWVMDDDTICTPDALKILVQKLEVVKEDVGFIASKCVWTDGEPHLMNIPSIQNAANKSIPFNKYDKYGLLLVEVNSFVSMMLNTLAVKTVGLPYKEFFIWGDDQEYTRRITDSGFLGLYCSDSIALHKTKVNYFPDFYHDTVPNLWKHAYGFRNEFFMVKRNRGIIYYFFWMLKNLPAKIKKVITSRKTDRARFIGVLLNSAWKSIFFNPKIDRASKI